jgi:hypothetical protein
MKWVSLGLALAGAITALAAWFIYENMDCVIVGGVIAFIGLWFNPRGRE